MRIARLGFNRSRRSWPAVQSAAGKNAGGGYKPDSVPSRRRSFILAGRYRPAPATYPGAVPAEAGGGDGRPSTPLFGLAPHGVYRALSVTGKAVRSYRTLSPLPTDNRRAVCFLRHFPSRCHGRALPGMLPVRSPDFPRRSEDRRERPPPPALERIAPTAHLSARPDQKSSSVAGIGLRDPSSSSS